MAYRLTPEDHHLELMPPPFQTVADEITYGNSFWTEDVSNVGEIDYAKAVIIADFGHGSDSTVILYYGDGSEPSVRYLKWHRTRHNETIHSWVQTHATFTAFATDVELL